MTISEALSAERERQGMSVYELAKRSGMSAGRAHAILATALFTLTREATP